MPGKTAKLPLVLIGLSLILFISFPPAVLAAAPAPPPQLMISKVAAVGLDTSNPTLVIEGVNFGSNPSVFMGMSGGALVPLFVVSAASNYISAQLTTATSAPGTYLLVVSRGPATTE